MVNNAYLLSIDTTTPYLSVVIARNGVALQQYQRKCDREHSQRLISVIQSVLKKSRLALRDIAGCGIDCGPGSFTGIRIGLATVKGLVMALNIPVMSFSALDVLADALPRRNEMLYCPIIDAKRAQVYSAVYRFKQKRMQRIHDYMLCEIGAVLKKIKQPVIFSGDAVALYRKRIEESLAEKAQYAPENLWYPQPTSLAAITYELYQHKQFSRSENLAPLYLYADTCTVRKTRDKG